MKEFVCQSALQAPRTTRQQSLTLVVTSTCSPLCRMAFTTPTWPRCDAVWMHRAPLLLGMWRGTPGGRGRVGTVDKIRHNCSVHSKEF